MNKEQIKGLLPSFFTKVKGSNLNKLLDVFLDEIKQTEVLIEQMDEWKDVDNAKGKVLDLLGNNIGQNRGMSTDEIYRVLIRGKFMRNSSDGSMNKIIHGLAASLDCPESDIYISNSYENADTDEPAALVIEKIPLKHLNAIGLTIGQFVQIVMQIIPAGVRLSFVNLEGTFAFSSTSEIEVCEEGFSDLEGKIGGFLGGSFGTDDDYKLPI